MRWVERRVWALPRPGLRVRQRHRAAGEPGAVRCRRRERHADLVLHEHLHVPSARPAFGAGPCDVAETCTGSAESCPADAFQPSSTVCRATAGECDVAEHCSGSTAPCPPDVVAKSATACTDDGNACTTDRCNGASVLCTHDADPACVCGNAIVEPDHDEQCDDGVANGTAASCCTETCTFRAEATECRPSMGACDVTERCSGVDATCPADTGRPDGTSCDDLLFCNGNDTCVGGQCAQHAGNPCPGPDGDANCAESCAEATHTCTAADPEGAPCSDGDQCTSSDRCSAGLCSPGEPVSCPNDQVCVPTTGQCGPSAICPPSCDDANPCTNDSCEAGECVSVAVTDGNTCQDDDECTTGTALCAAGTCGTRECDVQIRQVVLNSVPSIQVECLLLGRKPNGKQRTGTCSAKVAQATESASVVHGAAARRKKVPVLASSKGRIKNGVATLQLKLNARGRQLLAASPDGQLTVDFRAIIRSRGTKARINKLLTLRR